MKRRRALKHIGAGLSASFILPWLSSCKDEEINPEIDYKGTVAVIGAGAAGLYAADYLMAKGINVILFEASGKLGGRIRTLRPFDKVGAGLWFNEESKLSSDFPVELGADRIYGSDSIWANYINQQKFTTISLDDKTKDKFWLESSLQDFATASANANLQACFDFVNSLSTQNSNGTVQQAIQAAGIDPSMYGVLEGLIANKYGTSNDRLGMGGLIESASLKQRNNKELMLSHNPMADVLIEGFIKASEKTELNTVITEVDYLNEKVTLKGERLSGGASTPFTIEVDKVIVTVPVSVLKSGDIKFTPSLPAEKLNAFSKIGMDNSIRVLLDFRKNFWEAGFRNIYGADAAPEYFNTGEGRSAVARTLSVTISGKRADELSALGTDIIPKLLQDLDQMYSGQASANVRKDPKKDMFIAAVQDWGKEPFIKGSSSYLMPGGTTQHREALAMPLNDKVFFAGEATDFGGEAGTVNGALHSAERAAKELIKTIIT